MCFYNLISTSPRPPTLQIHPLCYDTSIPVHVHPGQPLFLPLRDPLQPLVAPALQLMPGRNRTREVLTRAYGHDTHLLHMRRHHPLPLLVTTPTPQLAIEHTYRTRVSQSRMCEY